MLILIFGSKSVIFAQKFRIFLEFLTLEGTLTLTQTVLFKLDFRKNIFSSSSLSLAK